MGQIHVLDSRLADRIAAGEVVERPASVLRELIDNALDAGAQRLEIVLEAGGREKVRVADDGSGMASDDAELAFERHATSKIRTAEQLDAIQTLGFRGEALAAISAVARVELITRRADEADAVRVVRRHGEVIAFEPHARAPGTTLTVTELFATTPARLKFLKTVGTELDHCVKVVQRAAYGHEKVGFRVEHDGKSLMAMAPARDRHARVLDLLGSRYSQKLLRAEADAGAYRVQAWVGPNDVHRATRDGLLMFVNRRPVRDPMLMRAVMDAYRHLLPAGRFPLAVVFVELPAEDVDVNVHPAKSEVRFHSPREVRALVVGALSRALTGKAAVPRMNPQPGPSANWNAPSAGAPAALFEPAVADRPSPYSVPGTTGSAEQGSWIERDGPAAIAQYKNCFILAEDREGLLVVDQHVVHERLLFEELQKQADGGPLPRQTLLFDHPVELTPRQRELIDEHPELWNRLGFVVEPFGDSAVRVREVPSVFGRQARPEQFQELLERVEAGDLPQGNELFRHLLATMACHAAVRKGMPLDRERMNYLLGGLDLLEVPTHCPHGRIISLRVDLAALDRRFGRA